jgi:hypothetical protein
MTTATWVLLQYGEHQTRPEDLGFLPMFLDPNDPRPAKEQLHENYQHGGGWHSMPGFSIGDDLELCYPGDPPMRPIAVTQIHDTKVLVYPHSWVVIMKPDDSFEVCRMD